jgi:cyanate permease
VPLLFAAAHLFDTELLAVAFAFVFLGVGALPISDSLVARYAPPQWRSRADGAKVVVGFGVASLGVPMVGLIYEHTGGFAWLFITLSGLALVVASAALFLPPERRASLAAARAAAPGQAD